MAGSASRRRLNEAIGALNRVVASPRLNATIADRSGVPLTPGTLRILGLVLEHGPLDLSRLAERSMLAPNALSRHVKALEAQAYVVREALPDDRRVSVVSVTAEGRDAVRRYLRANDRMMAGSLAGWTDDELDDLSWALERLVSDLRRPAVVAGDPVSPISVKERSA